jgi:hypothetical protein
MIGGFGMVHRLYPLEREVFDRVVLPLIAGHWKKAGRPPSVVHYDFFCGVLYVLGRGIRFIHGMNVGARVDFSGGCFVICRASKSCAWTSFLCMDPSFPFTDTALEPKKNKGPQAEEERGWGWPSASMGS